MRILILGLGLMGPTIAKDCAEAENVTKVTGCDIDQARLDEVYNYVDNTKFDVEVLSVLDHDKMVSKMKGYDLVIHGTASRFSMNALKAAMEAKVNIVDLAGGGYP
ncbi:MAG: saccharopine dehydrogenase NADP-binding domain-containing protein, partial [Candidatus Bathyarchaeota archaeon]